MIDEDSQVKVLIVDDDSIFRLGLRATIPDEAQMTVVEMLSNGQEAVDYLQENQVDVVLMDVDMPVMDGLEATRIIHQAWPDLPVIMLTSFHNDLWLRDALAAGARGFATKTIEPSALETAIRTVIAGRQFVEGRALDLLTMAYRDYQTYEDKADQEFEKLLQTLTNTEHQVWQLICQAMSNRDIARNLHLQEGTVRQYVSTIFQKLGVGTRTEVLLQAARNGKIS